MVWQCELALTFHFKLKLESSLSSVTNFGFQLYLQALITSHKSSLCDHPNAVRHRKCVFNLPASYTNALRPKICGFRQKVLRRAGHGDRSRAMSLVEANSQKSRVDLLLAGL